MRKGLRRLIDWFLGGNHCYFAPQATISDQRRPGIYPLGTVFYRYHCKSFVPVFLAFKRPNLAIPLAIRDVDYLATFSTG
jgi:hypothetical protein